jgi:hypothetical protein
VAPKPTAAELLETPGAVLTSSHLKELGWTRTHIDAIWRSCPMVILPGARRPVLRVEDYLAYLEEHTYRNEQPRVLHRSSRSVGHHRRNSRTAADAVPARKGARVEGRGPSHAPCSSRSSLGRGFWRV